MFIFSLNPELALRQAAAGGKFDKIKSLLSEHPKLNINAKGNESGQSALHRACLEGHKDIAVYLAIRGADINNTDKLGKSALTYCDEKKLPELKKQLSLIHEILIAQDAIQIIAQRLYDNADRKNENIFKQERARLIQPPDRKTLENKDELNLQCMQRSWALKVIDTHLSLIDKHKQIPDFCCVNYYSFVYLTQKLKTNFPETRVELIQYYSATQPISVNELLVLNRSSDTSIFKLEQDANVIIWDTADKSIYLANDEKYQQNSSFADYQSKNLRGQFVTSHFKYKLDSRDNAEYVEATIKKYEKEWDRILQHSLELFSINEKPSYTMR